MRRTGSAPLAEVASDDNNDNNSNIAEEDENGGVDPSPCANNWKAVQSDSKKQMWGIFAKTGFFASACCHGFILWIADMIWSGEQ